MKFTCHVFRFNSFSTQHLYEVLRLRQEVFAVEQNCAYQDCDNKDQEALHVCYYAGDELVALARILAPGAAYAGKSSIGRICTRHTYRKTGLGKLLVEECLRIIVESYPGHPVRIAAQSYLLPFYSSFGFVATDVAYYEDGIHHTEMEMTFA